MIVSRTCLSPKSLFQSFFNVFTQISPRDETFGWKIFVKKKPRKKEECNISEYSKSRKFRNA